MIRCDWLRKCLLVTCAFNIGCASIVSKSDYPVTISSNPQGAEITIVDDDGVTVFRGTTPTTTTLEAKAGFFKGQDYIVTFTLDGHQPVEAKIKRGLDGWYLFGNILIGGLIGWLIVDPLTGAMWTLKDLNVVMNPETGAQLTNDGLRVLTLNEVPESLRPHLVRVN